MIKRPILTTILYTIWIALNLASYVVMGFWLGIKGDAPHATFMWWALGWMLLIPTVVAPPIIYYSLTDQ